MLTPRCRLTKNVLDGRCRLRTCGGGRGNLENVSGNRWDQLEKKRKEKRMGGGIMWLWWTFVGDEPKW